MKTLYCPNNVKKNGSCERRFCSKQLFPVFLILSLFSRGVFAAEEEKPVFKVTERDHLTALSRISQLECQRAALEKYLKLLEEQNKAYLDQKIRTASSLKKVGKSFAHLSSSLLELDRLREGGIEQDLPLQKRETSSGIKNENQAFLKDSHGDLSPSFAQSPPSSSDEKASLIIQNLMREVSEKDCTIRELINDLERHDRTSPAHVPPVLPVFSPVLQKEAGTQTPFTISQHHEEIQTDTHPITNSETSPLAELPVQLPLLQRAYLAPQEDIVLKEVGNQTDFEEEIAPPHQRHGSVQTEEEHPQYRDVSIQAQASTQDAQTQKESVVVRGLAIQTDSDEEIIALPQGSVAVQRDHEAPHDVELQTEFHTQDAQTQKDLNFQNLLNKKADLKAEYALFKKTTSHELEHFKKSWEVFQALLLSRLDALEQEGKSLRTRNASLENQQKQADFLRIEKEALEDLTMQQREQIECLSNRRQRDRFDKAEGYGHAQQFTSYAQWKVDEVLESMMDLVSRTKDLSPHDISAFFDDMIRQRKSMTTHSRYFMGMEDVLLGLRDSILSLRGHSPSPSPSNPFTVAFDFREREGEEQPNHEQRQMVYDHPPTSLDEDPHKLSCLMREKKILDRQRMKEQKKWQKEEFRRSKKLEKENQRKSEEERKKTSWQKYRDSLVEAEEFFDTLDQDRGVTSYQVNFYPVKSGDYDDRHETLSRVPLNEMGFNRKTNQLFPKPPFLLMGEEENQNDDDPFLLISGSPLVPLKIHKAIQQIEHREKRPVLGRKHQGQPLEDKENIPMNRVIPSLKTSSHTSVNKSAPDKPSVMAGHQNDWLDVSCLVDMKRSSGRLSKPSLHLKQVDDINMRFFR